MDSYVYNTAKKHGVSNKKDAEKIFYDALQVAKTMTGIDMTVHTYAKGHKDLVQDIYVDLLTKKDRRRENYFNQYKTNEISLDEYLKLASKIK